MNVSNVYLNSLEQGNFNELGGPIIWILLQV